jgi:membrane-associated phospholipid phosphatase
MRQPVQSVPSWTMIITCVFAYGCAQPSHDKATPQQRESGCLKQVTAAQDKPHTSSSESPPTANTHLVGTNPDGEISGVTSRILDPNSSDVDGNRPSGTTGRTYVPWKERRGSAYPGDFWTSFGRDSKEMPATLWDDAKAVVTNPVSLIGIGLAGAAGIAISASGTDGEIAEQTLNHPTLNHFWDSFFDATGNPGTHFAVAGAMYFTSLATQDTKNYEISKTLINALAINGLTMLTLERSINTHSPNGDPFGWPSGHTSSSFTVATVLAEEYGPLAGVPAFAFASLVGFERIDARNHDFSDVVSGALIGMAIGHAVVQNHQPKVMGFEITPYADISGGVGMAMIKHF